MSSGRPAMPPSRAARHAASSGAGAQLRRIMRRARRLAALQWLWSERVLLIYSMDAAAALPPIENDGLACNRLEDLEAFEQTERWLDRDTFIAEARRRIASDMRLYTCVRDGVLLHFGWLVPSQDEATFPYVHQQHRFAPGTAVLFNAYTHPRARGQGLHERSMRRRIADAAAMPGTRQVCSAFESTNLVSRGVAERAGMRPATVLYERVRLGRRQAGAMSAAEWFARHGGAP